MRCDDWNEELGRHMGGYADIRAWRMGYDRAHWKRQLVRLRMQVLFESQEELADRIGVHRDTVRTWEECGTFPFKHHLERLESIGKEFAGWTRGDWARSKEEEGNE